MKSIHRKEEPWSLPKSIIRAEVPHGRADYILRAMNVPAGKHVVEFTFDPKSLHVTETIAFVALGILLLAIVVAVVLAWRKQKKE